MSPLNEEEIQNLADALHRAMVRLSIREYAAGEMGSYLRRKGFSKEIATAVVEDLVSRGEISDQRYSKVIARHHSMRDKGPMQILGKLRSKGVSLNLSEVRKIYGEVSDRNEVDQVRSILERRYPRANEEPALRQKAYQGLLRRGFSSDSIRKALDVPSADGEDS